MPSWFTYSPKQWTFALMIAVGQKNAFALGFGPFTIAFGRL